MTARFLTALGVALLLAFLIAVALAQESIYGAGANSGLNLLALIVILVVLIGVGNLFYGSNLPYKKAQARLRPPPPADPLDHGHALEPRVVSDTTEHS
jgi:hypothetical protein